MVEFDTDCPFYILQLGRGMTVYESREDWRDGNDGDTFT